MKGTPHTLKLVNKACRLLSVDNCINCPKLHLASVGPFCDGYGKNIEICECAKEYIANLERIPEGE